MQPVPSSTETSPALNLEASVQNSFNALFAAMKDYNAQFPPGRAVCGKGISVFNPQPESESLPVADQSKTAIETLNTEHSTILKLTGLAVSGVAGTLAAHYSSSGEDAAEMRSALYVDDRQAFHKFLTSLTPEMIRDTQFGVHLSGIPNLLATEVRTAADLHEPSDRTLNLLASLRSVVREYERLGLNDACAELKVYAEKTAEKILPEYLSVERQGLLLPLGKDFGPGTWQYDSIPSLFTQRWNSALATLETLGKKEEAAGLYNTVARHLEAMADSARQNIGEVRVEVRNELSATLTEVHRKLIPLCIQANILTTEDAPAVRDALAVLQRGTVPPHLLGMSDLYYNEVLRDDRVAININHSRDGRLLAHVCAAPGHIDKEAHIVTFAVAPASKGIGIEERAISEIESALAKRDYQAMRITLSESDPALKIIKRHYGDRARRVDSNFSGEQVVLRIELTHKN